MKRADIAELLFRLHLFDAVSIGASGRLIIFNYHRIRESESHTSLFNARLFGPSLTVFEDQIRWLVHNTCVLSQEDLLSSIQSGRLPHQRCTMITFDDGYRDNYTLAYPILRKYGIPAVFFIASGMIEARQLGWWDIIDYLINNSPNTQIRYRGQSYTLNGNRSVVVSSFITEMSRQRACETADLIPRLSDLCNVEIPSREVQSAELMTWEEIGEVSRNGITIGSHTHSHPVLATLDINTQKFELVESRRLIQARLGIEAESLAYPVGSYNDFTEDTRRLVPACGYKLAYSFATGINDWPCDRFDIRRISGPQTVAFLAGKASLPWFFARS